MEDVKNCIIIEQFDNVDDTVINVSIGTNLERMNRIAMLYLALDRECNTFKISKKQTKPNKIKKK